MILTLLTKEQREKLYLSYVNDFITTAAFADHYQITIDSARNFLDAMRLSS